MKKNQNKQSRILISVNVILSAGPIRLIVNEDDAVADVVSSVLKLYAHQGRLPVLGFEPGDFQLFCPAAGFGDLDPQTKIGACGNERSFMMWKKKNPLMIEHRDEGKKAVKATGAWKSWIKKSFKIAVSAQ